MSETLPVPVKKLLLDLTNARTVPQSSEVAAIQALISIQSSWFWALTESLLDDGYHATENVLVLRTKAGTGGKLVVKEGNRRVAALKIIHKLVDHKDCDVPEHIVKKIDAVSSAWTKENSQVPCAVFEPHEASMVERLVTLVHAKGDQAGRSKWPSVARARYNRDKEGGAEPGLDLLEKYLSKGKNLNSLQRERWSGDFPITVLTEAMQKIAPRMGLPSVKDLVARYPGSASERKMFDAIILDIGLEELGFKNLRGNEDVLGQKYGVPSAPSKSGAGSPNGGGGGQTGGGGAAGGGGSGTATPAKGSGRTRSYASNDPKSVTVLLRGFTPHGSGRGKLVTLRDEARSLKLSKTPHAFMFVLRSMFEISCKAYCDDHAATGGPKTTGPKGDRPLIDVLRDICSHLTSNKTDKAKMKVLHGAMTQLAKPDSIMSVTSMNQLVHNPRFSAAPGDIATLFGNVFPLLETMSEK